MKRCVPHALVRCATNEGVLAFRCFSCVHWESITFMSRCSVSKYGGPQKSMSLYGSHDLQGFVLRSKQKACFISNSEATGAGVWALHGGSTEAGKHRRDSWDVCEVWLCPCCGSWTPSALCVCSSSFRAHLYLLGCRCMCQYGTRTCYTEMNLKPWRLQAICILLCLI